MAKCVVCAATGMDNPIDEQRAMQENLTAEYQGRTYYFDSQQHKQMFEQDPQRYLQLAHEKGFSDTELAA